MHFELGKHAKTLFQPLIYDEKTDQSRVLLEPVTGRSHQLRVHMMHIGHPIMGDKLYHPEPKQFHLNRMALHAAYLAFHHPLNGTDVVIESQVPF
ncbi:Ribosomal large subunit pseudouridine synthase A [compost metagenome]